MVRVARRDDGTVSVDPDGGARAPGRGAYVCRDASCVERAVRSGGIKRSLRVEGTLGEELRLELLKRIEENDG